MLLRLRGWVRALLRRNAVEREMQEEMQLHLERATARLEARGMSPAAARAQARREFGNVAYLQDEGRDARGVRWIEDVAQDVRYAVRGVRLKPGFALAVISTLGLGIGANATMFGIVDRLLFRPPAYLSAPDRTHHLYFARILDGREYLGRAVEYQRFLDLTAASRTLDVLAAYSLRRLPLGSADNAPESPVGAASASLWQLFDARPALGRFFTANDDREPDGARVVVLSYAYWQSRYAGSPRVLGTTIRVGPSPYTVIGVAPEGFAGVELATPNAFVPLSVVAADEFGPMWNAERGAYAWRWLELYGRRMADATLEAASTELSLAYRESYRKQIATQPRSAPIEVAKPRIVLGSMLAERGPSRSADARVASWLLGVTAIVLLIACANVANLLLARALRRRREIALRIALGVRRWRLARQLLIESMVLAVLGALTGLLLAHWGGQLLRATLLPTVEWQSAITDRRVLVAAGLSAMIAGVLAGIAPILAANRSDVITALKTGARDGQGVRSRLRSALILAQVSLSVVLLIGAGLFVRSVEHVSRLRLGYDPERMLLVEAHLNGTMLDSAHKVALRETLMERATQSSLIESATLVCSVPFFGTCGASVFVDGVDSTSRFGEFVKQAASPAYFATTGTRLLRGRGISADDRAASPLVVVVSDGMARALWPGQDAIGQCVRSPTNTAPCRTVVGVVEDERHVSLGDEPILVYYFPATQAADKEWGDPQQVRLYVRVRGEAALQAEAVRREFQRTVTGSAYVVVRPMTSVLAPVTRSWRLGATMFAVFGALALVVAAIGLYSVVSFSVAQRRHEVGVRIALGARVVDVVSLVMRDGLVVVVAGVVVGMGLALAAGHWLDALLFQVSSRDPLVFGTVAVVLVGVAVAASGLPALRASRVDPTTALRSD